MHDAGHGLAYATTTQRDRWSKRPAAHPPALTTPQMCAPATSAASPLDAARAHLRRGQGSPTSSLVGTGARPPASVFAEEPAGFVVEAIS